MPTITKHPASLQPVVDGELNHLVLFAEMRLYGVCIRLANVDDLVVLITQLKLSCTRSSER